MQAPLALVGKAGFATSQPMPLHLVHGSGNPHRKKEFLINDLDERTLLVHAPYLDEILLEWKKYIDAITYQPPDKNALLAQQQQ